MEKWTSHGGVLFVDRLEAKAVITREQIEAVLSHTSSFLKGGFLFIHTGEELSEKAHLVGDQELRLRAEISDNEGRYPQESLKASSL